MCVSVLISVKYSISINSSLFISLSKVHSQLMHTRIILGAWINKCINLNTSSLRRRCGGPMVDILRNSKKSMLICFLRYFLNTYYNNGVNRNSQAATESVPFSKGFNNAFNDCCIFRNNLYNIYLPCPWWFWSKKRYHIWYFDKFNTIVFFHKCWIHSSTCWSQQFIFQTYSSM